MPNYDHNVIKFAFNNSIILNLCNYDNNVIATQLYVVYLCGSLG